MRRKFHTLDVFTDQPLAGNPLAVVVDAHGLDDARMQAIAREFNLSETVFVQEPLYPVNTARLRIFTPSRELPFAGHPTVGAAALIARLRAPELLKGQDLSLVLEEGVGDITCSVHQAKGRPAYASFVLPRLPEEEPLAGGDVASMAEALGLEPGDIGFEHHRPSRWTAGNAFTFVPVRTRDAVARARPDLSRFAAAFGGDRPAAFLYTPEVVHEGSHVHARMFAPGLGVFEDPATGSAAAAFAGVAMCFEAPEDGEHTIVIEQGFEMGRASLIHLSLGVVGGGLTFASIGGHVVHVSEGTIEA